MLLLIIAIICYITHVVEEAATTYQQTNNIKMENSELIKTYC